MRLPILIVATIAAGPLAARPPADAEAQIARALAGRIAGPPTDCIYQNRIRSTRIIPETAILYEMSNGTIYLNRPTAGGAFLRRDVALVTDTRDGSGRLCTVDIVRLLDTSIRQNVGTIGLGPFVPYARPGR